MTGKAWCFGDDIDTDAIIESGHMRRPDPQYWAAHVLERSRPDFAQGVQSGDLVIAGDNFGSGSSREHAAVALQAAGVAAVIARSFARNFYRNAWNNGLPLLECEPAVSAITEGDEVTVRLSSGEITDESLGQTWDACPIPEFLQRICAAGGLIPWLSSHDNAWPAQWA